MDPGLKLKENDLLMTENPGNPLNPMTTASWSYGPTATSLSSSASAEFPALLANSDHLRPSAARSFRPTLQSIADSRSPSQRLLFTVQSTL
ncbi:UNVERIFIED_CONTAM: hypothetical protein FKN15_062435 [Acipenser sinensis]